MKISSAMITAAALGMFFIMVGSGCSSQSGMNDKSGAKMESSMEEPMAEKMDMKPMPSSGEKGLDADMNKNMKNDMKNDMDTDMGTDMKTDEMAKPGHSGMEGEKEGDMHMPSKDPEKMMDQ